jgi:predicted Zn-dependent protease
MNMHRGFTSTARLLVFVVGVVWGGSSPAFGQLTAEQLLSTSIEKYDAKYADVGQAIAAFQKGKVAEARTLLVNLRKRQPLLAPPDTLLAMLHFSANQRDAAEQSLEQATINDPRDPEAFLLAGDLAIRERRMMMADLAYERAKRLMEPMTGESWRLQVLRKRLHAGLATLVESRKQYDVALTHLQAWQKLDPKNPVVLGSLGRVNFHRGDATAARAAFAELLKIETDAPPVEVAMGRLYTDAGNMAEALKSMTAVLKTNANDLRTLLTVGEWAINNGQMTMAKECVTAALKQDPAATGGQVLAGRLARYELDPKRAETILATAILKSPNEFAISNELARALALSDDAKQRKAGLDYAVRNYRVLRTRGNDASRESTMTYAWLLLKNNQVEEAEKVLHSLPDFSPVSSENAYYAAMIYKARGRDQLAKDALRAAIGSGTSFPSRDDALRLLKEMDGAPKVN